MRQMYYENVEDNLAFERCVDFMAKMMLKHGPAILRRQRELTSHGFWTFEIGCSRSGEHKVSRLCAYHAEYKKLTEKSA